MRHRVDTRMVGDPCAWYAQRDGADKVRTTKWAQQVVLYAVAMMETRGERPDTLERLEGRFDGTAVRFGEWVDKNGQPARKVPFKDTVLRFREVANYVLPDRQLPAPPPEKALPAPKVI